MSEPQPTYTTRPRPRHDDAEANAAAIIEATRRETLAAAEINGRKPTPEAS